MNALIKPVIRYFLKYYVKDGLDFYAKVKDVEGYTVELNAKLTTSRNEEKK